MHPLAVLRYCRDVLSERKRRDRGQGWFWSMRHKIVVYLIASLEREVDQNEIPPLTESERELVRQSHPLLGFRSDTGREAEHGKREWLFDLRQRVQRFMDARKVYR